MGSFRRKVDTQAFKMTVNACCEAAQIQGGYMSHFSPFVKIVKEDAWPQFNKLLHLKIQ